jgi:hypothetical protein
MPMNARDAMSYGHKFLYDAHKVDTLLQLDSSFYFCMVNSSSTDMNLFNPSTPSLFPLTPLPFFFFFSSLYLATVHGLSFSSEYRILYQDQLLF